MKILNVGYRSVNCYLLVTEKAKLLIDVGWPGGMQELKASLTNEGLSIKDVTHVLVTHYHMDHGAIAQELKDKGAKLIVLESQREHLNIQRKFIRPPMVFHEIREEGNILLKFGDSRVFLRNLGIDGEIISTTGHGQDHVTLILDEGIAFTGDLPPPNGAPEGSDVANDWVRLRSMKVTRVYPAHGAYDLPLEA
ncbi:MAG: MBL fold metallo-hydrolase [Candidatus Bathyarchaeota archaeon]|nr:MBL fold metallo-hydrolase [Candidatus Bathyarchaeota archaeon]